MVLNNFKDNYDIMKLFNMSCRDLNSFGTSKDFKDKFISVLFFKKMRLLKLKELGKILTKKFAEISKLRQKQLGR